MVFKIPSFYHAKTHFGHKTPVKPYKPTQSAQTQTNATQERYEVSRVTTQLPNGDYQTLVTFSDGTQMSSRSNTYNQVA